MSNSFKRYASEQYVDEKIASFQTPVDKTLSVEDAAADSKAVGDAIRNSMADWNQSDSLQANYIKNKPFYTDTSSMIEIPVVLGEWQQMIDGYPLYMLSCRRNSVDASKQIGDEISVSIDGKIYNGALVDVSGMLGFGDIDAILSQNIGAINFILQYQYNESYSFEDYAILYKIPDNIIPTEVKLYNGTPDIKKIDEKYLPDGTKITTRTPIALYEWDEDVVYSDIVSAPADIEFSNFAKISDNVISQDEFINKTVELKVLYDGQEIVQSASITSDLITSLGDSAYAVAEMIWVVLSDSCEISFMETSVTLTKGVWCPNDTIQSDDMPFQCRAITVFGDDYEYYVDEKYIPDTIARKNEIAQSDWNQNNEIAPDYIKNRTHWVDYETEVWANETDETTFYLQTMDLFVNDTFIVTVDGVKYLCPAFTSTWGSYCLGNSRLMVDHSNPDSPSPDMSNPVDMPFCVESTVDDMSFNPSNSMAYVTYSDNNPHTIKIEKVTGELIHQLDEKFIPDTIARKADLNNIDLSNFYSKSEIDNMEFITVDDIDAICGTTIINAVETDVKF